MMWSVLVMAGNGGEGGLKSSMLIWLDDSAVAADAKRKKDRQPAGASDPLRGNQCA
ncbi:hypothetical protein ACFQNF_01435 [Iodobacter arcticus]|uniref:Uncharacterized protein n=1 Tax=Iodobacter arcticus TaxID=590593 RepID=A0ABW2QS35_9NEIS